MKQELKELYPITVKLVADHRDLAYEIFEKLHIHKGGFIGVCELNGCFLCENVGELYSSLGFCERLALVRESSKSENPILNAVRTDGTVVGSLPFSDSILPNMLISRGVNVYCYAEAKEFNGGMLAIAVSIYCDEY
ncbi:MAG: hypothetical protein IJY88_06145 [Clostridia bacterium]|nr:hypothetical protein [Clostridia bacterium]